MWFTNTNCNQFSKPLYEATTRIIYSVLAKEEHWGNVAKGGHLLKGE